MTSYAHPIYSLLRMMILFQFLPIRSNTLQLNFRLISSAFLFLIDHHLYTFTSIVGGMLYSDDNNSSSLYGWMDLPYFMSNKKWSALKMNKRRPF